MRSWSGSALPSVNTADIDYLRGRPTFAGMTPGLYGLRAPTNRVLGLNVAGQVEAVGKEVTGFRPGDDVFGDMTQPGFGAFAEYVSAPERAFAMHPAALTYEESATLPHADVLPLQGMRSGRKIEPGHRVLINGASGSGGPFFAVQIAKALGAEVTGVCSTAKVEMVRSAGADHVIDYTQEDFTHAGRRYDRIVDIAGSHSIFACRRALRLRGTYLWVGGTIGEIGDGPPMLVDCLRPEEGEGAAYARSARPLAVIAPASHGGPQPAAQCRSSRLRGSILRCGPRAAP